MGFHFTLTGPPTCALCPVIPNNVCTLCLTAAAGTELAGASSRFGHGAKRFSYSVTAVYNPKAFILHAVSLRQAFAHCGRFSTAASRRSLGSVSVPVWPIALSGRLPVIALVSRYLTNKLIARNPLPQQPKPFTFSVMPHQGPSGITHRFRWLFQSGG